MLEKKGYAVIKSAGSMGAFDLIAFMPSLPDGGVKLIQVKSSKQLRKPCFAADLRQMKAATAPEQWSKELHYWWRRKWHIVKI